MTEIEGTKNSKPSSLETTIDSIRQRALITLHRAKRRILSAMSKFSGESPEKDPDIEEARLKAMDIATRLALTPEQVAAKTYYASKIDEVNEVDLTKHMGQVFRFELKSSAIVDTSPCYDFFVIIKEKERKYMFLLHSDKREGGRVSERFLVSPQNLYTLEARHIPYNSLQFKLQTVDKGDYVVDSVNDFATYTEIPEVVHALPAFWGTYRHGVQHVSSIAVISFGKSEPKKTYARQESPSGIRGWAGQSA